MENGQKFGFAENGRYFACYCDDGKLKLWETESGVLKQEYTPNFHLRSPCTSLVWVKLSREAITPKKKKKLKTSEYEDEVDALALGTASGNILLYCVASGDVKATLEGGPSSPVNCLSWSRSTNLFSCAGETILEWSVGEKIIKSKWKSGKDVLSHILVLPGGTRLLSASRSVVLWSLPGHERLKTFIGHATDVTAMVFIPPVPPAAEGYAITTAKNDRYLCAWSLNTENQSMSPVAQFVTEDTPVCLSVCPGSREDPTVMGTVAGSGSLHLYSLQLNGKTRKPLKPKQTVQIAATQNRSSGKDTVDSIPIRAAKMCGPAVVLLAHGHLPFLTFEKIMPNYSERVMYLVRQDPTRAVQQKKSLHSKVVEPVVASDAQYISPLVAPAEGAYKRTRKLHSDVPMEERLNNLTLNRPEAGAGSVPRADNVGRLLLQGLRSKDQHVVHSVLLQRDEAVIRRTVARLPVQVVEPLVQELTALMQGKVVRCRVAAQWLRAVISVHASQILASPGATACFLPVLGLVETRLGMLTPLSRLRGRLDLLMDQLSAAQKGSAQPLSDEGVLVYQDSYSSDEENLVDDRGAANSDSDANWDDLLEEGEESEEAEVDSEMTQD